jgi:cytoskeletal protein RodZ
MAEIGETLRETRMRRRIDITEVEAATKIRAKYLRALENEEWDLLPGPTFVKTFLRTYAQYLEIDDKLLVEEFKQRYERPAPETLAPFSPNLGARRRAPRPGPSPGLVLAGVLLAIVGLLALLGTLWPTDDEKPATNLVSPAAERTPEPTATPAARKRKPKRAATPKTVRVQIVPTGPVSVCLVDATGKQLIDNAILQAGDSTRRFRSRRFRVAFGNANARLRYGTRSIRVAESAEPIGYDVRPGRKPARVPNSRRVACG